MAVDEIKEGTVPAYIFEYDCQICGKHNTAILVSARFDPRAICPECAKRINELIYAPIWPKLEHAILYGEDDGK